MKRRISILFTFIAVGASIPALSGIAPAQEPTPGPEPAPVEKPADAAADQPEAEKPETEKPETEKPETEKPEEKPATENPPAENPPAEPNEQPQGADEPQPAKPEAPQPQSPRPESEGKDDPKEAQKPAEESAQKPADQPTEKPAETPAEKPEEKPAEKPADKPAESPTPETPAADAPSPDSPAPAPAERFGAAWTQWKALLDDMRALRDQYRSAAPADQPALREQWEALVGRGKELRQQLRDAGAEAFQAAPNENLQLAEFLVSVLKDETQRDQYEQAAPLAQVLIDNGCLVDDVYNWAGVTAFATHEFDKAEQYLGQAANRGVLQPEVTPYLSEATRYQELWKQEQELRAKEAEADDLPRVRLTTSQGEIVLELFENEAPGTVGNFVHLAETGFYDGLTFHRVLDGFVAQGGCPEGTGTGGPGYEIYCECEKENHRKHFRGSLSMAHAGKDTGGSQFFITFRPTPNLNGRHTVFGRVIEGMDVLAKLQRRDPSSTGPLPEPDQIMKAEVIRKRDHDYKPNKVQ